MKLILIFGCEKEFVGENQLRYERALSSIKNPENEFVCFTDYNVALIMAEKAKNDNRVKGFYIESKAQNTRENIEFSLPKFYWYEKIIFCSSWYHLPRIIILYWLLRRPYMKETKISILPVWIFSFNALRNALLELPKTILDLMNIFGLINKKVLTKLKMKYLT